VFEAELPEAEHFVSRLGYVMVWLKLHMGCVTVPVGIYNVGVLWLSAQMDGAGF